MVLRLALLSIVGILLSGCETLKKVDRGLYQVAETVSEKDRVTGQRSLSMANRSAQIKQGNAYVDRIIAQEKSRSAQLMPPLIVRSICD